MVNASKSRTYHRCYWSYCNPKYQQTFSKIKESLPELVQIVMKCIAENEANLQGLRIYKFTRHDLYICGLKSREFSKTPEAVETCKSMWYAKCGY